MVTQLQPVEGSSNIAEHGYDVGTRTLAVRFKSGALYHYRDVPAEVAKDFAGAESMGSYLARNIKPGFEAELIDESDDG